RRCNDLADPCMPSRLEDIQGAEDVDLGVPYRIIDRTLFADGGGQMEHEIAPADGRIHCVADTDVTVQERDVQSVQVPAITRGEVVENPDADTPVAQARDEVRSDESRATSDQCFHVSLARDLADLPACRRATNSAMSRT